MKYCKHCWKLNENSLLKYCYEHKHLNKTLNSKPRKSINKVSSKRKERIKSWDSEKSLFLEIWNERERVCEICWTKILEAKSYCFAHRAPKGTYPEHRLKKDNISLVCSIKCHLEVDKIFSWIKRAEHITFLNKSL